MDPKAHVKPIIILQISNFENSIECVSYVFSAKKIPLLANKLTNACRIGRLHVKTKINTDFPVKNAVTLTVYGCRKPQGDVDP